MIEELEEKIFDWLPYDEKLEPFYLGVAKFVEDHIDFDKSQIVSKPKEILDPCVGYVKLNRWEVAILDTSLFQRLRKITQLGLAYLVYPTLRYSRFEHTIGVLGRLNQTLQTLKEKPNKISEDDGEVIPLEEILHKYETQIRLAALFHDVGHCLFSHLSEDVINQLPGSENYPSVDFIKKIFKENFTSYHTNLSIAEIFSISILGTKKVAEVLFHNNIFIPEIKNEPIMQTPDDLSPYLLQSARFIAGVPIETDAKTVFLAQLISSGLDADKLDYMSREEHFSGIKIEMDLERILNKIKLFHISDESNLPKELLKYSLNLGRNIRKDFIVLGIEKGGQFSYEEFCVARLALYEKIYLHKKVRAAESFFKKKLEKLINVNDLFKNAHNWLYLRESIIETNFKFIQENFTQAKAGELDLSLVVGKAEKISFTDIEKRLIPHRAFGFGPANSKTDSDISKRAEYGGIEENHLILDSVRLWIKLNPSQRFNSAKPSLIDDLSREIIKEAIKIILAIKQCKERKQKYIPELMRIFELDKKNIDNKIDEVENGIYEKIERNFVVDVPDYRRVQLKYESLNFEEASYQTVRWTIPIDQIARYYQLHRILAYVYAEQKYCAIIHVAAEMVIYKYLDISKLVYDQTQVVSKDIRKQVIEIKDYLNCDLLKYYKNSEDLLPINPELSKVSSKVKINQVLHKLNRLMYFNNNGLTYLDIEKFLKQFEIKLQLPALDFINCIEVLNNDDLYEEIKEELSIINSASNEDLPVGILPLGSYMSSSSYMLKEFKPFFHRHNISLLNFTDSESFKKVKHILLIDDNINTGRQAVNIVAKMIGLGSDKLNDLYQPKVHSINGEGEKITDPEILKHFKETPLSFIFITGHEKSDETLEGYLKDICGLDKIKIIIKHKLKDEDKFFSGNADIDDNELSLNIFKASKANFKQPAGKTIELKKFLELVGKQVVKKRSIIKTHGQPEHEHCLGYSNRESLVIFPGSVPTMTITALWCSGEYQDDNGNNKYWKALIERPENLIT